LQEVSWWFDNFCHKTAQAGTGVT